MADTAINSLNSHGSISSGDKLLGVGTNEEFLIDYDLLAKAIIENYSKSSLGGSAQSLKTAIDDLQNDTLKQDYADVYGSKNLLEITAENQTVAGVTFTVNKDGSITANGTATDTIFYKCRADGFFDLASNTYILNGCPHSGSTTTHRLYVGRRNADDTSWEDNYYDYGEGVEFAIDKTRKYCVIIRIESGYTANNLTFYPMIRLASTGDTYEPYVPTNRTLGIITNPFWQSTNNAATHNGIFRGKDLTNIYTIDEICSRISSGTFEDLYIGDYFDITISTEYTSSEIVRCVLAGFDYYYGSGDSAFMKHHAVIVPKNAFTKTHQMNSTDTTEGGYINSGIMNVLSEYSGALNAIFGNHSLTHRCLFTYSVDSSLDSIAGAGFKGSSNKWFWQNSTISLLSEIQLYGSTVLSSSFYDTGIENLQLPLFALNPTAKVCKLGGTDTYVSTNRMWWWLRAVASASAFALCYLNGTSTYYGAAAAGGVRPLFCIG